MEHMNARDIHAALVKPFAPEDLEWRLQQVNEEKPWGIAVPYVTNRAIQNRLDDVVGPDNWYNDYKPWHGSGKKDAQICGISIYFEGKGWITKWDGAEDSDIEPIKGGLSDSMKRAAVQWGIGRVLYNMDSVFVDVEKRGKSWYIAKKELPKLNKAYTDMLTSLGLTPAKAGGTQPQIVPTGAPDKAQQQKPAPEKKAAAEQPKEQPSGNVVQLPTAQPAYQFKVVNARVQNGMSGSNTQLVLETVDGKRINAFVRGAHPELTPEAKLTNVKLTMRKQDTVVFYVLEEYQMLAMQEAA